MFTNAILSIKKMRLERKKKKKHERSYLDQQKSISRLCSFRRHITHSKCGFERVIKK